METMTERQRIISDLAAKKFLERIESGKLATDIAMGVYVSCGEAAAVAMQGLVVERIMKGRSPKGEKVNPKVKR